MNKDLAQYRANRADSNVVKTWLNNYKQSVMLEVIHRDSMDTAFNQD